MSQVFPATSMDISLFYPISDRLHGYYPIFTRFPRACTDITLFWPSSMVLPYFRHPPWTLPHFVAFRTASMDITLFYPISDRMHGHYPSLPSFRPPPWILPYFLHALASHELTRFSQTTHYHTWQSPTATRPSIQAIPRGTKPTDNIPPQ